MTVHKLDNTSWGFASNCFVCEPKNAQGLRIPFTFNDETGLVEAEFTLDDAFSGAPSYAHGGVTLAIMDEAMSWATIAALKSFAVTQTTTTTFLRPVTIGRTYRVRARIEATADDGIDVTAVVINERDKPCAEGRARFVPLSAEQATSAIGVTPTGEDAGYVKGG